MIKENKDAMGAAIIDFARNGKAGTLRVLSSMFEEDEMPVPHLFRKFTEMPPIEQTALGMAKGRILDVGAGAGCHALALQDTGADVTAIDISPLSCEAMRLRGIRQVECIDLFDRRLEGKYDTILLLMNGTGIAGKVKRLPLLFRRLQEILAPEGQILIDSSDLRYIYEDEDGNLDWDPEDGYYGEVDYQMVYKNVEGEPFDWLYCDYDLLSTVAEANGFHCSLVAEGAHYDYLARLTF